jgi:hypothetical protein
MNILKNLSRFVFSGDNHSLSRQRRSLRDFSAGQILLELLGGEFEVQVGRSASSAQCWYRKAKILIQKHHESSNPYDFELVVVRIPGDDQTDEVPLEKLGDHEKIFLLDSAMNFRKYKALDEDFMIFEWNSVTMDGVIYRFKFLWTQQEHLCELFELTVLQCIYGKHFKVDSFDLSEDEIRRWNMMKMVQIERKTSTATNEADSLVDQSSKNSPLESKEHYNSSCVSSNDSKYLVLCKKVPEEAQLLFDILADLFVFNPSTCEFLIFSRNTRVSLYSSPNFMCKCGCYYFLCTEF